MSDQQQPEWRPAEEKWVRMGVTGLIWELNSIIVTTHDIGAALAIADTVILLGRERDATGALIPGANVRYTYNLMDMGLTWRPNVEELPQFHELEREIVARFAEL